MESLVDDFAQWVYFNANNGVSACMSKKKNDVKLNASTFLVPLGLPFQSPSSHICFQASLLEEQLNQLVFEKPVGFGGQCVVHFELLKDDGGIEHLFDSSASSLKTTNTMWEMLGLVGENAESLGLDVLFMDVPHNGLNIGIGLQANALTVGEFYRQMLLLRATSESLANARGIKVSSVAIKFGEGQGLEISTHLAETLLAYV